MVIQFVVPGSITSSNRVTRHTAVPVKGSAKQKWRAIAYKPPEVKDDEERIRQLAIVAKALAGWMVPHTAQVAIYAYNSRLDVGNIDKIISDAIKRGVLIVDDRKKHLQALFVQHMPDDHRGERYLVRVTAIHPTLF